MLLALALIGGLAIPSASHGQAQIKSMSWTEVNRLDANSLISRIASLGGMNPSGVSENELHVQDGKVMISSQGDGMAMIDFARDEFKIIDHASRSVIQGQMSSAAEMMLELSTGMLDSARSLIASSGGPGMMAGAQTGQSMSFRVYTHRNVARRMIGSHETDVHYVVVQTEMEPPPGTERPAPSRDSVSSTAFMWFINELWESKDLPSEADLFSESELYEMLLESGLMDIANAGGTSSDPAASFGFLDSWSPGMGQAMYAMMEEVAQFEGNILRSVISMSMTPVGVVLDLPEIETMVEADPSISSANPSIGGVVRGALGGLLGRGRPQAQDSPDPDPNYTPFFRMTSTREDFRFWEWEGDMVSEINAQIEGYKVQSMEEMMEQAMRGVPPGR